MNNVKKLSLAIAGVTALGGVNTQVSAQGRAVLEEVTVTAQRREQSAQDIGVAITAMSGDMLREFNMTTTADIASQVPNLEIKSTLGASNPVVTIRGIGLNDFNANNSQSAGVYIDEVFLSSPAMMGLQLFDIDRVEVLKGPQGTLYGRNTTAGAINFISRRPSQEFDAYVTAGIGKYDTYDFSGAVGGGVTDNLAARLAWTYQDRSGGYIDNRFTGNDEYGSYETSAWRALLSWDLGDSADLLLNVHSGKTEGDSLATWKPLGVVNPETFDFCDSFLTSGMSSPGCTDYLGYEDPYRNDPHRGEWSNDPSMDMESSGASAILNWDLGFATLTSVSGYEGFQRDLEEDTDGPFQQVDIAYDNELSLFSQELRLTSNSQGSFSWIAGVFYSKEKAEGTPNQLIQSRDLLGTVLSAAWDQETAAIAAFAHTEWQFTDQLKLIAGLRYTDEEKDFEAVSLDENPWDSSLLVGPVGPVVFASTDDTFTDDNVSGKLGLDWTPGDDLLVYTSVSTGFKSGGFNGGFSFSDAELQPFDSETLTAYELGFKSSLLDGSMQLNGAVFYYDYQDMQLFLTPPGELTLRLTNADEAEVRGAELELKWRPALGLDLTAGLSYLDTENKDPQFDGLELPNSPEYSFNGSARYEWSLTDQLDMAVLIGVSYTDEMFKGIENEPMMRADSYTLVDARISLLGAERWELAAWADNLTDEEYVNEVFSQVSSTGAYLYSYGAPADYGVTFTYYW